MFKNLLVTTIIFFLITFSSIAEKVKKIDIKGNNRISNETIILFGEIDENADLTNEDLNIILKRLYETNFF